jgi:small subunit ribosomal protein S6
MKNKYEVTVVLDPRGKETSLDKIIGEIGKEIESEGAHLEQIDHIGRRKFAYTPYKVDEGVYVNFLFETEPTNIDKVRSRLKLNADVYRMHLQRRCA